MTQNRTGGNLATQKKDPASLRISFEEDERLSLVINRSKKGLYEMVSKQFNGKESLQFLCSKIGKEDGNDSLTGAYQAQKKGDRLQKPKLVAKLLYEDGHGKKEIFIYEGTGTGLFKKSLHPVEYLTEEAVKSSPKVTDLMKAAFDEYLKRKKKRILLN